jgi:CelD/BcsL family acetyltransferase involved in cellulose biosynthesis
MGVEPFLERRAEPRHLPARARGVVAGDSVFVVSSWKTWADAEAVARWDALAERAAEPNPFFEAWYLLPALRRFDPDGRVVIVRFARGGALVGLLPIVRSWRYQHWPLPHLSAWTHANGFVAAPLVATGEGRAFWSAFLAWCDAHAGPALFAHLPHLPLDGPLAAALAAECAHGGRRLALVHREERAMLRSELGPEAYLERAVRAKKRKELRRQHARLAEQGTLQVERQTDDLALATWIDHFLALEAAGWKGKAGSALAARDATAGLFREALRGGGGGAGSSG